MIIDYLSDLHIDSYFVREFVSRDSVERLYFDTFTDSGNRSAGDVLIIAGDIGHNNEENISVLKHIKEIFGYKHIICVLGNHDYYLLTFLAENTYQFDSLLRAKEMRKLINSEEGMYCLDGNIIEIDGIRFGGCDSWYDGKYTQKNIDPDPSEPNIKIDDIYMDRLRNKSLNDASYIYGMKWLQYGKKEKKKLDKIYKKVDVMITHVNPSIEKMHTDKAFRENELSGFFSFDGSKYFKNSSIKYWVFGHTHTKISFKIENTLCVCNPMGYSKESRYGEDTRIKSFILSP